MHIAVRKGFDLDLPGAPVPGVPEPLEVPRVGLIGADYGAIRAEILVEEGAFVGRGAPLFRDRRQPEIVVTAPASGRVTSISLGPRRRLSLLTLERAEVPPKQFAIPTLSRETEVRALLLESGLWTGLRSRPFDAIPAPDTSAATLFVTAMDTAPHAVPAAPVIAQASGAFELGLAALDAIHEGPIHVCQAPGSPVTRARGRIGIVTFSGPHPAGLPGTHMHYLAPVDRAAPAWHIHYQDVIAIGHLLDKGVLPEDRVVSIAGPGTAAPGLFRVTPGSDLHGLTRNRLTAGPKQILSGSVLSGLESGFLGRYHWQVCVLNARPERRESNWLLKALGTASAPMPLIPTRALDRSLGLRLPTVPLLRALSVGDDETFERWGGLELAEEDLALASYASGGRTDFARLLRGALDRLGAGA